jgi:hypothetical protein
MLAYVSLSLLLCLHISVPYPSLEAACVGGYQFVRSTDEEVARGGVAGALRAPLAKRGISAASWTSQQLHRNLVEQSI